MDGDVVKGAMAEGPAAGYTCYREFLVSQVAQLADRLAAEHERQLQMVREGRPVTAAVPHRGSAEGRWAPISAQHRYSMDPGSLASPRLRVEPPTGVAGFSLPPEPWFQASLATTQRGGPDPQRSNAAHRRATGASILLRSGSTASSLAQNALLRSGSAVKPALLDAASRGASPKVVTAENSPKQPQQSLQQQHQPEPLNQASSGVSTGTGGAWSSLTAKQPQIADVPSCREEPCSTKRLYESQCSSAIEAPEVPTLEGATAESAVPTNVPGCVNRLTNSCIQESDDRSSIISVPQPCPEKNFALLPTWQAAASTTAKKMKTVLARAKSSISVNDQDEEHEEEEDRGDSFEFAKRGQSGCWLENYVIHPYAMKRVAWDLFTIVLVSYECILIPLLLIDLPEGAFLKAMAWFTRIFWTIDLFLSLLTGFIRPEGNVELRLRLVMSNYLRTWFVVDVIILSFDWAEVFVGGINGSSAARMGKVVKSVRMVRMVRLSRVVRIQMLPDVVRSIMYYLRSEFAGTIISFIKVVVLLVWLNHVIACCWCFLASTDDARNWMVHMGIEDADLSYKYLTSYHWSLTQFSGAMEATPQNTTERAFAVSVLILAFILSALIVSSITTSMTRLAVATSMDVTRLTNLNEYLYSKKISAGLMLRVQRNAKHAMLEQKRIRPNIELLALVSEPLRLELHFEVHAPVLTTHPFFKRYSEVNKAVIMQVCHRAVENLYLTRGDSLFLDGDMPHEPKVYFVTGGSFTYVQTDGDGVTVEEVGNGEWLSEAVLWTAWEHRGTTTARATSTLVVLDSQTFQKIMAPIQALDPTVRKYAEAFMRHLNTIPQRMLSDLPDPGMDFESMIVESCPSVYLKQGVFNISKLRGGRSSFLG